MYRTTIAAVAALLAFAPSALAEGTLTKAEVIKQGTGICKAAEKSVERLPQPRSQNPFSATAPKGDAARGEAFLKGYADALQSIRTGLAGLKAPTQDRQLLQSFLAQLGPVIATFRQARTDALEGHNTTAIHTVQRAFALWTKASAKTRAYGFPKGVCQSGSS